jgi:hypothetical protein
MREKYDCSDQVHTTSGSGMPISHIGQSTVHTQNRDLFLKDVLHVLSASKNSLSVHKFTYDNNAFFEIHPWYFLLKDRDTRKPLLHERCRNGLYPLPVVVLSKQRVTKSVLATIKPFVARWHYRLGHASSPIVQRVLSGNNLSCSKEKLDAWVCDVCQRAKSHQLPFPKSVSMSKVPLELVFSDVWGLAPISVGRFKYYVSFIDEYNKFA